MLKWFADDHPCLSKDFKGTILLVVATGYPKYMYLINYGTYGILWLCIKTGQVTICMVYLMVNKHVNGNP